MTSEAPGSPEIPAGWYDDGSGKRRWWTGNAWTERLEEPPIPVVPGRVLGFVLGLAAALFVAIPLLCLPLGIVGWVKSLKALRALPQGASGRGLAIAGLILAVAAVCLTTLFMILAIPGAFQHNFG